MPPQPLFRDRPQELAAGSNQVNFVPKLPKPRKHSLIWTDEDGCENRDGLGAENGSRSSLAMPKASSMLKQCLTIGLRKKALARASQMFSSPLSSAVSTPSISNPKMIFEIFITSFILGLRRWRDRRALKL